MKLRCSVDIRCAPLRKGFTLLELLLATLIGAMLLGGLYVILNMTLTQTQASRDAVDAEDLSRSVFNKISLDLSSVLGPQPPKSGEAAAPTGTAAPIADTSTTTDTTTTTNSTTTTTPSSSTTTTNSATQTTMTGSSTTGGNSSATGQGLSPLMAFQVGVMGTDTQLSIFASRVPDILATPGALNLPPNTVNQQPADLYRIDYWIGANGGLCRKEHPWVTADQIGNVSDIDRSTEPTDVLVEDVTAVLFEYLTNSTATAASWDQNSATPPAPPAAVRITLTFNVPNANGGPPTQNIISQVFAIRTAPGTVVPTLVDPVTSSGSTPSTGTSTGTTGTSSASGSGGSKTTTGTTTGTTGAAGGKATTTKPGG